MVQHPVDHFTNLNAPSGETGVGKERAGGSTGTPTKSEKVKERYMIWRERKWKVEVGKVQRRFGYPAANVQWCFAERETPH